MLQDWENLDYTRVTLSTSLIAGSLTGVYELMTVSQDSRDQALKMTSIILNRIVLCQHHGVHNVRLT